MDTGLADLVGFAFALVVAFVFCILDARRWMNDRINLRLLFTVLAFVCAVCFAGNAQAQDLLVEFDSFEKIETAHDGEFENEETKQAFGFIAIKKRIKKRLIADGASEQDAEDVAANVAGSVCKDGCPGGCVVKKNPNGWFWRRKSDDRWYPGKAIGEAAVEAKDWFFFGINFAFWSSILLFVGIPLVIVVAIVLIIYAFRGRK